MKKGNISNKLFYTLIVFGAILFFGAGVYAITATSGVLNDGSSVDPGHSIQSVSAPEGCASGQVLQYLVTCTDQSNTNCNGYWACRTISSTGTDCSSCDDIFVNEGDTIDAPDYCDANGQNCFEATDVKSLSLTTQTIKEENSGDYVVEATCPSGTTIVSGGCYCSEYVRATRISTTTSNSWYCLCSDSGSGTLRYAHAYCLNL